MAIIQLVLVIVPTQKRQFNASKYMLLATTQSNYKDKKTSNAVRLAIQTESLLLQLIAKFREVESSLITQFIDDLKVQFAFA